MYTLCTGMIKNIAAQYLYNGIWVLSDASKALELVDHGILLGILIKVSLLVF